ncbi:SHG1 (YBR258C) [Zygosaccharomyces parabailii]|nr:SHG1 (YBR258C) [Zygosaccharomyces parabailii]CDH11348.1 related to COMPASS component SHG1 [Zygosaccharomyces bailii ISA1307]
MPEIDQARKLADEFKREGHFDKLKRAILTQKYGDANEPIEQSIKNNVATVVRQMVAEDENLIFRNRGSTSALIEAQLFKQGYRKLEEGESGIQLEEYLRSTLKDPQLVQEIRNNLLTLEQKDD